MAKILAPNGDYTGVSASVSFVQGVGQTEDPHLITWFRETGYEVIEDEVIEDADDLPELSELTKEARIQLAQKNGISTEGKKKSEVIEELRAAGLGR